MVDKPKLDQMLASLRQYAAVLAGLSRVPRDVFLANPDKLGNAKYHFIIAIESCIDISNHVIASEGYRFPQDNADAFVVLTDEGILAAAQRAPLQAIARFRNRLVHLYQDIDDGAVHDYLRSSLSDLEAFAQAIARQEW